MVLKYQISSFSPHIFTMTRITGNFISPFLLVRWREKCQYKEAAKGLESVSVSLGSWLSLWEQSPTLRGGRLCSRLTSRALRS